MKSLAIALLVCLAACSASKPEEHTETVTGFAVVLSSVAHFVKTAPNCYKRTIEWTATAQDGHVSFFLPPEHMHAQEQIEAEVREFDNLKNDAGHGPTPEAAVADFMRKHPEVQH